MFAAALRGKKAKREEVNCARVKSGVIQRRKVAFTNSPKNGEKNGAFLFERYSKFSNRVRLIQRGLFFCTDLFDASLHTLHSAAAWAEIQNS